MVALVGDAELDEGLAERLRILADARALKNLATAFLHPENPVVTTDGDACGRNYFSRPSAPLQMEDEDADEIAEILEDALKLKKAARAYLHPRILLSPKMPWCLVATTSTAPWLLRWKFWRRPTNSLASLLMPWP